MLRNMYLKRYGQRYGWIGVKTERQRKRNKITKKLLKENKRQKRIL